MSALDHVGERTKEKAMKTRWYIYSAIIDQVMYNADALNPNVHEGWTQLQSKNYCGPHLQASYELKDAPFVDGNYADLKKFLRHLQTELQNLSVKEVT